MGKWIRNFGNILTEMGGDGELEIGRQSFSARDTIIQGKCNLLTILLVVSVSRPTEGKGRGGFSISLVPL